MDSFLKLLKPALSWKSLILSGLIPSVLLMLGIQFCLRGGSRVIETIRSSFVNTRGFVGDFAVWLIVTGTLTLFLYAVRPLLFDFCRRIPLPFLRSWRLAAFERKREKAYLAEQYSLWRLNVSLWHSAEFARDQFVPEVVRHSRKSRTLNEVLPKSSRVRSSLKGIGQKTRDLDALYYSRGSLNRIQRVERWIAHRYDRVLWRLKRHGTFDVLQELHLLACDRTLVENKARELSNLRATQNPDPLRDWADAQEALEVRAPDDRLELELDGWREMCRSSSRIRSYVASLNDYAVYERYASSSARKSQYPDAHWIEPTRLGNIFGALEGYSVDQYGIDTATLWSRLECILPERHLQEFLNAQLALSALLNLTAVFAFLSVFGLFTATLRVWRCWQPPGRPSPQAYTDLVNQCWQAMVFFGAVFFATWCLHRASNFAATLVRNKVEALVDEHVMRWLRSLGFAPQNSFERAKLLQQLGQFFAGATPLPDNLTFVPVAEPTFAQNKDK
jgi:hypothetical protein